MFRSALPSTSSIRPTTAALGPRHRSLTPYHHTLRARHASSQTPSPGSSSEPQPRPAHALGRPSSAKAEPSSDRLEEIKESLREWSNSTSTELRQRVDKLTANVASTFSHLGGELNRMTGYEEIELLKRRVAEQEERISTARQAARAAKEAHDRAVRERAVSQREVNDLLQRKSNWTDGDVGRFTTLVREDHLREQEEARMKVDAIQAEDAVEREFSELMRVILNRYHEEQAWSDKIRSASTYGSMLVLGVNTLVFVLAIVLVEPWKRRRLAQTFERKVDALAEHTTTLFQDRTEQLSDQLKEQEQLMARILETVYYNTQAATVTPAVNERSMPEGASTDEESTQALNRQVAIAIASSAAVASFLGWLAGSWFG